MGIAIRGVEARATLALLAIAACGGADDRVEKREARSDTMPETATTSMYFAVQVASLGDSSSAARLRDSLDRGGWPVFVSRGEASGKNVWRVRLLPTPDAEFSRAAAFALRTRMTGKGQNPVVVRDSAAMTGARVSAITRVNRGSHGMSARVRWTLAPDRRTILVMEDPVSVEAEAMPNGFVLASEQPMRRVQMDSVWDVSPSPDWSRAAFGRAYVLRAGEADSLPSSVWEALAKRLRMPVRDVRSGSFPVSGMAYMVGFAQPGILHLESGERELFGVAAGWRVRWSKDGSLLAAGRNPERVNDDSPATLWVALDTANGRPRGAIQGASDGSSQFFEPEWTDGPALDISLPVDTAARVSIPVEEGQIESSGGWIRVRGRIIGPGVALAATLGARYVAALMPDPDAEEFDPKHILVVYTLSR